ncbi:uncharacterized protein J4E84_008383 [Alternaria hordeiaustralica]|uniref:uncharacterized protein n=1 Tax=Alternaria hordeiaustralica TaxID=1187925 RepID=UPI0020C429C3|nr:uncharacterized protein J4E84_008383 [Alternaria hordeiaustralica]KAI4679354.1 hypothetical protein J4E84_008383 [Alternaria hordeiaustralica]
MATDHIGRLPAELKCAVVRYLPALQDRKTMSLLSRDWAVVVMPIMWEIFTTDLLAKTGSRNVLGLASPASNIVKHVRKINLLDRPNAFKEADQLPPLLAAIPRGQLCGFKSGSGVPISTLELLLQIHPKLEHFLVPGTSMSQILQSPWTGSSLSGLTRMEVSINTLTPREFRKLWVRCPKLTHIYMTQSKSVTSTSISLQEGHFGVDTTSAVSQGGSDTTQSDMVSFQLSSLRISALMLPATFSTMFQRIDIIALTELVLVHTGRVAELLEAMCSEFQKREPSLRKLRLLLVNEDASDYILSQLQLLLCSFHGLRQLHFECGNCVKIDVDGIINHGETLTDLLIVNGGIHRQDANRCMSVEDLRKVAIACPSLEQLCLNLYEIDPDSPEGDFLGPKISVLPASTEFERALSAIASMKSLRLLRLTNPPNCRKAYHRQGEFMRFFRRSLESGEQRYAFQARADSIVRYVGDRASNLRLLAFSPMESLTKAISADKNGHIWPNYFYTCEQMKSNRGTEVSIARAVRDWKAEMPEATILNEG